MGAKFVRGEGWSALVLEAPRERFVMFAPCSVPGRKGWPAKERLGPFPSYEAAYAKVREIVHTGTGSAYVES
jgi:hypothetical protein